MPGPPLRPMPRTTSTWPGVDGRRPGWRRSPRRRRRTRWRGPAKRDCRPGSRTPSLTIALSGRERARAGRRSRLVGERPIERPDHVGVVDHGARRGSRRRCAPVTVQRRRSSSGSSCFSSARAPPAASNCLDRVVAVRGARRSAPGPVAELVEQLVDVDVEPGLDRGRLQVLDAVDRAADAEHGRDRVAERRRA